MSLPSECWCWAQQRDFCTCTRDKTTLPDCPCKVPRPQGGELLPEARLALVPAGGLRARGDGAAEALGPGGALHSGCSDGGFRLVGWWLQTVLKVSDKVKHESQIFGECVNGKSSIKVTVI